MRPRPSHFTHDASTPSSRIAPWRRPPLPPPHPPLLEAAAAATHPRKQRRRRRSALLFSLAPSASKPSKTRPTSTPASIPFATNVASKHEKSLSSVRCPLCKTKNLSIIHAFDGESFERWYINQEPKKRHLSDAHDLVSQFYNMKEITSSISGVQQYWEQQKYLRKKIWLETWLRREIQALTPP
ncbi:unnamed protein product [Urochloa humidicola]